MRYCSVKNCVNNDVSGSEIFHNIQKEWIEQVIWKTKHPIFICSEYFYEKYDLNDQFESLDISDDLSEAQNGCIEYIEYISGFLVNKLKSSTKCNICLNTMLPSTENENCKPSLIQQKDRGGLIYPWKNLVKVCEISEKK